MTRVPLDADAMAAKLREGEKALRLMGDRLRADIVGGCATIIEQGHLDRLHLRIARDAYFAAGGRDDDPRRAQKVSRIQIAIRDGSDGVLADPETRP